MVSMDRGDAEIGDGVRLGFTGSAGPSDEPDRGREGGGGGYHRAQGDGAAMS